MSFTSDSWKKSGGINRTSRHNLVRTPFAINNTLRISDTIGTDPSVNTIFDSSIIVNGDASFNGTSDFNGTVDFNEDVIFNGSITNNGPTRIVIDISQTEYLTINSNTGILPTDVISSLLLQNDSQRPSMLAYNITNTTTLDTITTNNLIFSISGDTVSVGEGFGDSTFNVFGDANISDICSNVFISNVTQSLGSRGEENVAIGVDAFINSNDNCRDNTAIGTGAMYRCTIGNGNVCLGRHALYNTDKGDLNTAIGKGSLGEAGLNYNVLDFSYNTAIGYRSGYNMLKNATNGSAQFNTFLGPQADVFDSSQSYSYSTAIGANAKIDASNQIVLGTVNENVVIPGELNVSGDVEGQSFNATSDARYKDNICGLENSLEKICSIRGVNYNWKNDETKTKTAGVIAQEVLEQIPEAVNDNDSEKLSVNYNSIIAHLIESVKELKREIDELKAK